MGTGKAPSVCKGESLTLATALQLHELQEEAVHILFGGTSHQHMAFTQLVHLHT